MASVLLASQALVLAIVLAASGIIKLSAPRADWPVLALARMTGQARAVNVLRVVAGFEFVVAIWLVLASSSLWVRLVALGLTAGFAAFTALSYAFWREGSCGCLGHLSSQSISAASLVRATLLMVCAATSLAAPERWLTALGSEPGVFLAITVAESLGFGVLFCTDFASGRVRVATSAQDCATASVPTQVTSARLFASEAWSLLRRYLLSREPVEQWREGCWRFICYDALVAGEAAIGVFAVRLPPDPPFCTGALVLAKSDHIARQVGSIADLPQTLIGHLAQAG